MKKKEKKEEARNRRNAKKKMMEKEDKGQKLALWFGEELTVHFRLLHLIYGLHDLLCIC